MKNPEFEDKSSKLEMAFKRHAIDDFWAGDIAEKYREYVGRKLQLLSGEVSAELAGETVGIDYAVDDFLAKEGDLSRNENIARMRDIDMKLSELLGLTLVNDPNLTPIGPVTEKKGRKSEFASRLEVVEGIETMENLTAAEQVALMDAAFANPRVVESLVDKEVRYRHASLNALIGVLMTEANNIAGSHTWGEWLEQAFTEYDDETVSRQKRAEDLIKVLQTEGAAAINEGETLEHFLQTNPNGRNVMSFLRKNPLEGFLDPDSGKFLDVTDESSLMKAREAVVAFHMSHRGYDKAEEIMYEVFDEELSELREKKMSDKLRRDYLLRSRAMAEAAVKSHMDEWAKEKDADGNPIMTPEMIRAAENYLADQQYARLENAYLMEFFMTRRGISSDKIGIWKQYVDLAAPEMFSWNMDERTFDMVTDLVLKEAPLILVSGGVGYLAGKSIVTLARVAHGFATLNKAGRIARLTRYASAGETFLATEIAAGTRVTMLGTELLTSGLAYKYTEMKFHGKNLFDQPDWVVQVVMASAAYGMFRAIDLAAPVMAATRPIQSVINSRAYAAVVGRITEINQYAGGMLKYLLGKGNLQAAAMLTLKFAAACEQQNIELFVGDVQGQLFASFVEAYGLHFAGKTANVVIKGVIEPVADMVVLRQRARQIELASIEAGLPDFEGRVNNGIMTGSIEVSGVGVLTAVVGRLQRLGFKIDVTTDGAVAKRGGDVVNISKGRALQSVKGRIAKAVEKALGGDESGRRAAYNEIVDALVGADMPRSKARIVGLIVLFGPGVARAEGGGWSELLTILTTLLGNGGWIILGILGVSATAFAVGKTKAARRYTAPGSLKRALPSPNNRGPEVNGRNVTLDVEIVRLEDNSNADVTPLGDAVTNLIDIMTQFEPRLRENTLFIRGLEALQTAESLLTDINQRPRRKLEAGETAREVNLAAVKIALKTFENMVRRLPNNFVTDAIGGLAGGSNAVRGAGKSFEKVMKSSGRQKLKMLAALGLILGAGAGIWYLTKEPEKLVIGDGMMTSVDGKTEKPKFSFLYTKNGEKIFIASVMRFPGLKIYIGTDGKRYLKDANNKAVLYQ